MFALDSVQFQNILEQLQETCLRKNLTLATAESCTGGLLAASLTHLSGSSAYFQGGVNTYANSAKTKLLGVDPQLIQHFGAVSAEVAFAMASGVRNLCETDLAISITGIAGPKGGSPDKPVGTVFCGWSKAGETKTSRFQFPGSREEVRAASCLAALTEMLRWIT